MSQLAHSGQRPSNDVVAPASRPDPAAVLRTYERYRADWESTAWGQFVAIFEDGAVGPFSTLRAAMLAGRDRFGQVPITVLRIGEPRRSGEMP